MATEHPTRAQFESELTRFVEGMLFFFKQKTAYEI